MPLDANAVIKDLDAKTEKYWDGISERTRALCLGSLVLIWGIFSQKKGDVVIAFSFRQKLALLSIALMSVVVIGCDLLEYLAAFQYHRRAGGTKVIFNSLHYAQWERAMRFMKIAIGLLALIAICLIVGSALVSKLHAQGLQNHNQFRGTWCGGDRNAGQYICLQITNPEGRVEMALSWQGRAGTLGYHDIIFRDDGALTGVCRRASLVNVLA
jgi:hypothetical protein